jgi:hypothetical protein
VHEAVKSILLAIGWLFGWVPFRARIPGKESALAALCPATA